MLSGPFRKVNDFLKMGKGKRAFRSAGVDEENGLGVAPFVTQQARDAGGGGRNLLAANAVSIFREALERDGDADRSDDGASLGADRRRYAADPFLEFAVVGGVALIANLRANLGQLVEIADGLFGERLEFLRPENSLQIAFVAVRQQGLAVRGAIKRYQLAC